MVMASWMIATISPQRRQASPAFKAFVEALRYRG
jgi:hypothetical protein